MARYALVIGIGSNIAPLKSLSKTVGDATAIAELLERQGNFVEVKRLIGDVTQAQLEKALQTLLQQQAERNEVVIYYTGHGFPVVESFGKRRAYLAPSDCEILVREGQVVGQKRGIPLDGLNGLIGDANLSNLVLLLECCYGGALLESRLVQETMTAFSRKDYFLVAACREFEKAYALRDDDHSIFTTALLRGLAEEKNDRGQVTTGRLFDFIYSELQGSGQEPICLGGGRSLTLVSYPIAALEPQVINPTNPYQGLLAFTKETAKFFFGRDRVVQDLVGKLYHSNFVPLIGASGSGKSSVVRAGLVPRLEESGWRVLEPMKPGTEPLAALALLTEELGETIAEKTLVVVDQFEEVFTLCRDRGQQGQFIQGLMALPQRGRGAVVVTMRADFVEACLADQALTQAIQTDAVWLGAMAESELEMAIVQPAKLQGMTFQERLLAAILRDGAAEPNCLPLVEFALSQLWELRSGAELTVAAYEKLGGVTGALNAHAEEIYRQLAARKQEQWVQPILLRLVRTGEGTRDTRQRQRRSDLLGLGRLGAEQEQIEAVIGTLVDGRLLVSDSLRDGKAEGVGDHDVIDLSHEALMQSWKRFAEWRQQDREVRRLVDKIEDARREWNDRGQRWRDLLDGRLLKDAKRLLKARSQDLLVARSFIRQSLWWRRSQMVAVVVIPTLILGIPAEYFWREEAVKRDYDRIERLSGLGDREAALSLAGGCWAKKQHAQLPVYLRERVFGNCRSLRSVNLEKADLPSANLSGANLSNANLSGADL